ncbi:MAG: response regulator, partial [bacterium]|nr:response regulator [bacterium]
QIELQAQKLKQANTELEKHAREVEIQKENAEMANQAKRLFLANMSHDIRTPLTSVVGHTELLLPLITDKKQRSYLENIKASSKTLKELIDSAIYMSKLVTQKLELKIAPANIYTIFNEIRSTFAFQVHRKHLEYITRIAPAVPQYLDLDRVRLKEIVIHLIDNALRYIDKGYIKQTVKAENFDRYSGQFVDLTIIVEDSGAGIPPENQERLFEPFERLVDKDRKEQDGVGLGLSIAKGILQLMNGEISLQSTPGKGSTFTVFLKKVPVASDQLGVDDNEMFDYSSIDFDRQKILIADDEEDNRKIIACYIEETNLRVFEAGDGQEALEVAKKHKPDLILMDMTMPVMNGLEAAEKIKQHPNLKNIPVFALTADRTCLDDQDKDKKPFDHYLFKPISKARLFCELANFLKTKTAEEAPEAQQTGDFGSFNLTAENKKRIPEILEKLDESMELWDNICNANNFNEFINFGITIKETGEKYSLEPLTNFGHTVIVEAESYNIKALKTILNQYPVLVENFKRRDKEAQ